VRKERREDETKPHPRDHALTRPSVICIYLRRSMAETVFFPARSAKNSTLKFFCGVHLNIAGRDCPLFPLPRLDERIPSSLTFILYIISQYQIERNSNG
jgi:hypothetical protein